MNGDGQTSYWDISDLYSEAEVRALFDTAERTIQEAGFDPVRFGRQKTETPVPSQHKVDKI